VHALREQGRGEEEDGGEAAGEHRGIKAGPARVRYSRGSPHAPHVRVPGTLDAPTTPPREMTAAASSRVRRPVAVSRRLGVVNRQRE
jgi:hypothetical protein